MGTVGPRALTGDPAGKPAITARKRGNYFFLSVLIDTRGLGKTDPRVHAFNTGKSRV